jgi:hypothetical protein
MVNETIPDPTGDKGSALEPPKFPKDERTPQQKCEDRGGFWDAERQVCLLFEPEPEPTPPTNDEPEPPKDEPPKGIVIETPEGVFNVPPSEVENVQAIIAKQQARSGAARTTQILPDAESKRLQQLVSQIGQPGALTAAQEADINFSQAATAGAASAVPGIIGGAIGGATVGALGGPIGAVGGAVLLGAGTFISGLLGNIKEQQRGELRAARTELTAARTSMRQLAMMASRDPANADVYINQYNQILTRVHQARRQTMAETKGDLNAWMEDGREDLALFDSFLRPNGIADIYGQKLAVSLQTGVPLSINGEELFLDEENEGGQ